MFFPAVPREPTRVALFCWQCMQQAVYNPGGLYEVPLQSHRFPHQGKWCRQWCLQMLQQHPQCRYPAIFLDHF